MIPAFRKKSSFLQALHPAAALMLGLSLMILSLIVNNPLCQVAVIAATAMMAFSAGVFREWLSWWKICLAVGLLTLIINPLVSRYGSTVIWRGPSVPVLGHLIITAEAVAYGAGMALRLVAVIWVFALVTLTVDPDSVLGLLKGRGSSSALLSALALRMVPTTLRDASDLLDAQRSRGIALDKGSRWAVLKSRMPLLKRAVSTSLDRGIGLAEAMESRAYGSGRRTSYQHHGFGLLDALALLAAAAILAAGISGAATGLANFNYYPVLSMRHGAATVALILAPVVTALFIMAVSELWKRSNWLRLRT